MKRNRYHHCEPSAARTGYGRLGTSPFAQYPVDMARQGAQSALGFPPVVLEDLVTTGHIPRIHLNSTAR
jgi:hypothetical protein